MIQTISVEQLEKWLQQKEPLQLIDVRTTEEHEHLGCISAVLRIPLHELPDNLHQLDANQKTVVICQHGVRSADATYFLQHVKGFKEVYNLEEGMSSWTGPLELGSNSETAPTILNNH